MPTPRESSIWGKIRKELGNVQQMMLGGQYNQAVITIREILKVLVRMQIDRAVLVSNTLEGDIDQLYDNRLISAETRDHYHMLRSYGEQADANQPVSAQIANDAFALIKDELSAYVDRSQAHRAAYEAAHQDDMAPEEESTGVNGNPSAAYREGVDAMRTARMQREEDDVDVPMTQRRSSSGRGQRPTRPLRESERITRTSERNVQRRNANAARASMNRRNNRYGRRPQRKEFDLYSILKFVIPAIIVILVIIFIRVLLNNTKSTLETTAAAQTSQVVVETTAAPETVPVETTPPETTAAPTLWMTTTDGVRVRASATTDSSIVIMIDDAGTQVTYKGDAPDNAEWAAVEYGGKSGFIKKTLLQSVAPETQAQAG